MKSQAQAAVLPSPTQDEANKVRMFAGAAPPEPTAKGAPVEPPTPSQEEANEIKAQVILGRDAKAEDDELPPPVVHDPPAPSQAEANEIKAQSALGGMDITAPVNVDVPHAQPDTASVGDTVTCTMGNWNMQPSAYSYQWLRGGTEVGSGPSYVTVEGDAGHSLSCVVTASNAIGSTVAPPSNEVEIAPASRRVEPAPAPASSAAGPAATTREPASPQKK